MDQNQITADELEEFSRALLAERKARAQMLVITHDLREKYSISEGDIIDEFSGRILRAQKTPATKPASEPARG